MKHGQLPRLIFQACRLIVTERKRTVRREAQKIVTRIRHLKQFEELETDLADSLEVMFQAQIDDAQKSLAGLPDRETDREDPEGEAEKIQDHIFDPAQWEDVIVDVSLPILYQAMGEAAVEELARLGVDTSKHYEGTLKSKLGALSGTKASTATEWLEENEDEELPPGVGTEFPDWMKTRISREVKTSFAQPWWARTANTTANQIQTFLRDGVRNGHSVQTMAKNMSDRFADFPRSRALNVARTESGNALNAARKVAVDQLKEEIPDVPMFQVWLSVLGLTTRDSHAQLHNVPENEDGMWFLGGVAVPWPAHWELEPAERCNCQCSTVTEFGVPDDDAQQAIGEFDFESGEVE